MHRLFVALRPPPPMRAALLAITGGLDPARWQDDEQLHLTLAFIGDVDRHQAEDIAAGLGNVRHSPVTFRLDGVGSFDRRGRVDTLWAGVSPHAPLATLHARVARALAMAGARVEARAFLPHITLARFAPGSVNIAPFAAAHAGLTSAPATVDAFALFESHLGRGGARYEAVTRYPLVA